MTSIHAWRQTWDQQQDLHEPDRETRFAIMLEYVEFFAGTPKRVLDLACGTGSITERVRSRFPNTTIVALDTDPILLSLAAAAFSDDTSVEIVDRNLNDENWYEGLPGHFDAVLTATALHWLSEDAIRRVYCGVAELLRPGGIFANADHMPLADSALRDAADRMHAAYIARAVTSGAETCDQWYERAFTEFAQLAPVRAARFAHWNGDLMRPVSWHLTALVEAGFGAADAVWRRGNDAMVVAVKR